MVEQIIAPGSHANVEADDGFFFGVGAFETIAVSGRVPIFFDKHLARMGEALRFLGIKDDTADLRALVLRACAELDPASEMALKLTVTERNRVVSFRQNPYVAPGAKCAFRCDFSDVRRCETSHFTYMKTLAYAENIVEKRYAQERGIDEPLFSQCRRTDCRGGRFQYLCGLWRRGCNPSRDVRSASGYHASVCYREDGGAGASSHSCRVASGR